MTNTWVVVAENSRAKIYEMESRGAPLRELADLVHPQSRQHESNITSDLPGSNAAGDDVSHHHMSESTPPKEQEAIYFSKEIVTRLERERDQGSFDQLMIAAAPAFLGHLRKNMNDQLSKLIVNEIDKNLVHLSAQELKAYF